MHSAYIFAREGAGVVGGSTPSVRKPSYLKRPESVVINDFYAQQRIEGAEQ
jgi:hypothetical protein